VCPGDVKHAIGQVAILVFLDQPEAGLTAAAGPDTKSSVADSPGSSAMRQRIETIGSSTEPRPEVRSRRRARGEATVRPA
jgi:hypothetical protein